jgi:putative Mg2+ transporter-C (MgtC) family protein
MNFPWEYVHVRHNLDITGPVLFRIIFSAFLGGIVGLERAIRHKPAGLRTNMFICVGAATFTLLSDELATKYGIGDHTRIAAQIIPGIGFLGAGAIMRERGGVIGLTTAATMFVVASIGMAVGGGLYWTAATSSFVILLLLIVVGQLESVFGLKIRRMVFRVTAQNVEPTMSATNAAFAESHVTIESLQVLRTAQEYVMEFEANVSLHQQKKLAAKITPLGTKFELLFTLAGRSVGEAG